MTAVSQSALSQALDALLTHDYGALIASDTTKASDCDVVMKGGITSGVVYPLAILELAKTHRFHSIGGTSVGAMAASVTAAAEYGRGQDGFKQLIGMVKQLIEPGFIANLFQPTPTLRPLMQLLFLVLKMRRFVGKLDARSSIRELSGDVLRFVLALTTATKRVPAFVGGLFGGILGVILGGGWVVAAFSVGNPVGSALSAVWGVLLIAFCWWIGNAIGLMFQMIAIDLPQHGFGVCSGLSEQSHDRNRIVAGSQQSSPALTSWLSAQIDCIAGLEKANTSPLTYGQLLLNHLPEVDRAKKIVLNSVTTNLSQGQPAILPFNEQIFLFSEQEWESLFPLTIMEHLKNHLATYPFFTAPTTFVDAHGQEHTLHFLPTGNDLPVVVGTRLSLSFPFLLSAVPIWTISASALKDMQLGIVGQPFQLTAQCVRRNWFSDGGICSNFPIHFYDRLVSTHPTFGFNLGDLPDISESQPEPYDFQLELNYDGTLVNHPVRQARAENVSVDTDNGIIFPTSYPHDRPGVAWKTLDNQPFEFAKAILNTGLFYRDNLQARLPSYYDRVITILLNGKEGGLNLDMPLESFGHVALKGQIAGQRLTGSFRFDHHRWVRLRLLLSQLEQQMIELHQILFKTPLATYPAKRDATLQEITQLLRAYQITDNPIRELLNAELQAYQNQETQFPYPQDDAWVQQVLPRLHVLLLLAEVWGGSKVASFQLSNQRTQIDTINDAEDHIRLRVTPEL